MTVYKFHIILPISILHHFEMKDLNDIIHDHRLIWILQKKFHLLIFSAPNKLKFLLNMKSIDLHYITSDCFFISSGAAFQICMLKSWLKPFSPVLVHPFYWQFLLAKILSVFDILVQDSANTKLFGIPKEFEFNHLPKQINPKKSL